MSVEKVFFSLVATVCSIGCYGDSVFTRNVLLDNRKVCDASSYTLASLPLDQCARLCHSDSSCLSFVYNDEKCELLSRIHVDPEDSYSEPGNVEFRKRDAESVCDIPTSIVKGRVLHTNGLVVGSKAEYICDDFHIPTTENGICDLSGEWVGLDTPCQHTLLSPYSIPAVDKIRQGSCLVVTATPTANTKFRLLLQKVSTDTNFLFSPRFTPDSSPEITRNTKINGIWGSAEKNAPFWPFTVNQEFNLTVCAEETMYRVHVDNAEMFTYAYRRPISEITYVLLDRDVALRRIRFVGPAGKYC